MKKFSLFLIPWACVVFSCSDENKIEKGSDLYKLAKALTLKVAYLDPDENRVLARTKKFKITSNEILLSLEKTHGKKVWGFKFIKPKEIREIIEQRAESLAMKRLMLSDAKNYTIEVSDAEIDSVYRTQYEQHGSEIKFLSHLRNLGIDPENVRSEIRISLIVKKYLEQLLAVEISVTEEEIQEVYQNSTASVRHILLKTEGKSESEKAKIRKKMAGLLERARNGEDFATLARQYSEGGSKDNGGLLENFARGKMVTPFEEAAFSVPVGEISDIIETVFGYHILKVIDRKAETQPLEEVRAELEAKLKEKKYQKASNKYMIKLKKEAGFELVTS